MSEWDVIVGIDIDEWMRADTPEQVSWLAWLRDNPLPTPEPPPCTCEQVEVYTFGEAHVRTVPGWPDPNCPKHGGAA